MSEEKSTFVRMHIPFEKYQGTGNDFIMIDNRDVSFPESTELVQKMCNRRFGIGSDGILLLRDSGQADVYLDFINPDGSRSFCGNGSRCGLRFAHSLGLVGELCSFEAIDGLHEAELSPEHVTISLGQEIEVRKEEKGLFLDTGSPHLICNVPAGLDLMDVKKRGADIRYSEDYRLLGVNVNFVEQLGERELKIRTYERGVEDETLSCGTGVTAAALALAYSEKLAEGPVSVKSLGGQLSVDFVQKDRRFLNVRLQGSAQAVYKGEWYED